MISEYQQNLDLILSDYEQSDGSDYDITLQEGNLNNQLGNIEDNLKENDSDQDIDNYHQLLIDNYIDETKIQEFSHNSPSLKQCDSDFQGRFADNKSVLSVNSTGSVKSLAQNYSVETGRSFGLKYNSSGFPNNDTSDKKRYIKQQSKRIKKELKEEEMKQKKEKKQYRQLDSVIDGKRRRIGGMKGRKGKFSIRTLQLLNDKFKKHYQMEDDINYEGIRLSLSEIGKMFEIGQGTLSKIYQEWQEDCSFDLRIGREQKRLRGGPERQLTLQRLQHLARLLKENPFMTQNELTVELNKIEDLKFERDGKKIEITRTTVSRLLKLARFKKKRVKCVPKQRNTTKSFEKRRIYCQNYRDILMKRARIYFLDESGFNLYMTRDKAWARPNQQITVNCPINKGKRFSLIAIIAQDGLTHWRIIEGTYRKYQYLDFIRMFFIKIREQIDDMTEEELQLQENQKEKWLILDNCAIHDRQQTNKLAQDCGMNILYLPPYSPQLNPIEMWFSEIKCRIRKTNYSGEKQLLDIMQRVLREYEQFDFSNYFSGILKHVEKGINGEKF